MRFLSLRTVLLLGFCVSCGGPTVTTLDRAPGPGDQEANAEGGSAGDSNGGNAAGGRAGAPSAKPNVDAGTANTGGVAALNGRDAGATPDAPIPRATPDAQVVTDPAPDAAPKPVLLPELRLTSVEDTYVQGSGNGVDNSNANFGTEPVLIVKYRPTDEQFFWREAYVRFDLKDVATIAKATMVLTAKMSKDATSSALEARPLMGNWSELGTTWAMLRPAMGDVLAVEKIPEQQPAKLSFDVTAYVKMLRLQGITSASFGLTMAVDTVNETYERFEIDSREAGATGPTLIIAQQ